MLRTTHALIGAIIGILFGIWLHYVGHSPIMIFACIGITIWAALLPDYIDPPTSFFHRSIGHNIVSLIMFGILAIFGLALAIIFHSWSYNWLFIIPTAFSFGFLSHLILDISTPMGSPMFLGKSSLGIIEIPLFLVPFINLVMFVVMIVFAINGIRSLAKKIGGIWAIILLFIPIWGALLLFGIALLTLSGVFWHILGIILLILFIIAIIILISIGMAIDKAVVKFPDKLMKSIKNKR